MNNDKKIFLDRFTTLYKGKRLLAIQLNGFTHAVFYDDKSAGAPVGAYSVDHYSGCMSHDEAQSYGYNNAAVTLLFAGYPNAYYQNNAIELVYVDPRKN